MSHRLLDPKFLAGRWRLNGHARDVSGHSNHGTLVNTPTWDVFNRGRKQCIRLDGNTQHVNLSDLPYLNAVSAFTLCFWMNWDAFGVTDYIFYKFIDVTHDVAITAVAGTVYFKIRDGLGTFGTFNQAAELSTNHWHHVAMIFDGSGVANIDRLIVYVDGSPVALGFVGTIPAATPDLTGIDALIGRTIETFDGRLYDWRIYNVPLSRDEINKIIHDPLMAR